MTIIYWLDAAILAVAIFFILTQALIDRSR